MRVKYMLLVNTPGSDIYFTGQHGVLYHKATEATPQAIIYIKLVGGPMSANVCPTDTDQQCSAHVASTSIHRLG